MLSSTSRVLDNYFSVPDEFRQIVYNVQHNLITNIDIDDALLTLFKCKPEAYEQVASEQMAVLGAALADNTSVVKLVIDGWMFPSKGLAALAEALRKNKTLATLKVDIYAHQELPALADILKQNTGLKYLALTVQGASGNESLPAIAKSLETHRTLLSFEIIDAARMLNENTINLLKELPGKNKSLMSFTLDAGQEHKRDFCQENRDAECGHAPVLPAPAFDPNELARHFQALANVQAVNVQAVNVQAEQNPPQKQEPDLHTLHLEGMAAPELRTRQLENMLMPELRAQELELSIAQAQHDQEQLIRDSEYRVQRDIDSAIVTQTRAQELRVQEIERKLAHEEKALRDIELNMIRGVQAGRLQFGLIQPVIAMPPRPVPKQSKRVPFTKEEITLVRAYLENLYVSSKSEIEKRSIDKLRCPISAEIMEYPVFLAPDGRTYDRSELLKLLELGKDTCPETRRQFSVKDMGPDYGMISIIQEFLEDAIKAKAKLEGEKNNSCCKP